MIDDYIGKHGLESLSEFKVSDLVEQAADLGFRHFEIGLDLYQIFPISFNSEEIQTLRKIKMNHNITYSAHLPFLSLDLATPNKFIREGSVQSMVDAYNSVKEMEQDIDYFVLHPAGETTADILKYMGDSSLSSLVVPQFSAAALQSINHFILESGIARNKLAIENVEFPLNATLGLIRDLGAKMCLDTAHLLGGLSGDFDLLKTLDSCYDLIGEIHLQDYSNLNPMGDHAALGTGKNFPPEFLQQLLDRNFQGPIVFELPLGDIQVSCEYIEKNVPNLRNLPHF